MDLVERDAALQAFDRLLAATRQGSGHVLLVSAQSGVTWVHSYLTDDLRKTFCIYDAPTPDAIRESAHNNNLPIDSITSVSVLDPYFYRG
jgi:hypothetical protein